MVHKPSSIILAAVVAIGLGATAQAGVLLVAGSPGYDPDTSTGLKDGEIVYAPGWGVNNSGMAVGSSVSYISGSPMGSRGVRWDYTGTAATELGNLGTSSGITDAYAYAVNTVGTAVGYATKYVSGIPDPVSLGSRPVRWDYTGTAATELGNLGTTDGVSGYTDAVALAVNDAGTAVGRSNKYVSNVMNGTRAVRWDASGTVATELDNLGTRAIGGITSAEAYAINTAGMSVGAALVWNGNIPQGVRAVRWAASPSTAATELGNLGGITEARALAINDDGTAVGYSQKPGAVSQVGNRAVRWAALSTIATELDNLGLRSDDFTDARAVAVNATGTAVGYSQKYDLGTLVGTRAVRWDGSGIAATELGNLGLDTNDSTNAYACAVNSAGSAVGYSQKYVSNSYVGDRAVIWLPDASAIDLNDLGIAPVGEGGTWILTTAHAISADGWVAGSGTFDPDGADPLAGYVRHWVTQVGLGGTWTSAAGGTWGRGPNWSTGTPAMQVGNATFDLGSVYTVALDRDERTKTVAVAAGTVTINSNGHTLMAESGLSIAAGATLKADGTIIGDIVNAGTLAPGAGVGTLAAPGSVTMAADSIYEWELGESSADKVVVTGNLTLDDGWKVTLVDAGGSPTFADKFDLFTYGSYTGLPSFDWHNIDASATGWDVSRASIGTNGGTVYITGIVGVPGDTNDDGVVDAADFITLKRNFGQSTVLDISAGDFDGDGTVEWDDLQTLMTHLGQTQLGAPATAPEPGSAILLTLGAAALLRRRGTKPVDVHRK